MSSKDIFHISASLLPVPATSCVFFLVKNFIFTNTYYFKTTKSNEQLFSNILL